MKKIISLLLGALFIISVQAQVSVSEYTNSLGQSFKVDLLLKKDKPYRVTIECKTKTGEGEIWLKLSEVSKFRKSLSELKSKFEEWDKVAKDKGVTDASKDMPVKFPRVEFVWGLSTKFFADDTFKPRWVIKSPVEMVLCMAFVKAWNNEFAKESFSIDFYSIQDVQNLIDALSQEKIDAAVKSLENSNLFN